MPLIMIIYYLMSIFVAALVIWNFIRERQDKEKMLLYLIVLVPLLLRIFRIR